MDCSVGNPEVPEISKKPRSLDLKSIYAEIPRDSVGDSSTQHQESKVLKRKQGSLFGGEGHGFVEPRKKRSRKISLSSLNPLIRRRRNVLSRLNPNVFVSGTGKHKSPSSASNNLQERNSPLAKKKTNSTQSVGNSERSNGLDETVTVPKRARGMLRKRRPESSISRKRARDIKTCNLSTDCVPPSRESISNEFKETGLCGHNSDQSIKVTNDISIKTRRRNSRSRKLQVSTMEAQIRGENHQKSSGMILDEDEENLERNAARMLSSRFDPSCTGVLEIKMTSSNPEGESFPQLFHDSFKAPTPEGSSIHDEGRALRPRRQNGKGFVRKRRHFYEVRYSDMDPYWVVKQRIKVFWPLDQNWYFGLVKDYDPATKLHHVKYDDRDEEWISLRNERFKLLLFPSEIKFSSGNKSSKEREKNKEGDRSKNDESCVKNMRESETINSWLSRANRAVKLTSVRSQKQERDDHVKKFVPLSVNPSSRNSEKLSASCIAPEKSIEGRISGDSVRQGKVDPHIRKLSFVYSRKRFRSRREDFGDKSKGKSACESSSGPINLLAFVADRESSLEKNYSFIMPEEPKQITLKLTLPLPCIHQHTLEPENSLFFSNIFHHFGKLTHLYTMIRMEIVFVDNALGLRLFTFEVGLRLAVTLVCLVMRTYKKCNKSSKRQEPYTSVGFKLSCLPDKRGRFVFAFYSFMELDSGKWRYLETKLQQQSVKKRELPVEGFTYVNIKNLSSGINQILYTPILVDPVSLEGFPESSCSDIMQQLILNISTCLDSDPGPRYFDEKSQILPACARPLSSTPSFLLALHLKLLMGNSPAPNISCKSNSASSLHCQENCGVYTGECSSPVEDSPDQVSEITIENVGEETFAQPQGLPCSLKSHQSAEKSSSPFLDGLFREKVHTANTQTPEITELEDQLSDMGRRASLYPTDLLCGMDEGIIRSPRTTGPRSIWRRDRHSSVSPTSGHRSRLWTEGYIRNRFVLPCKKPRTQVSYTWAIGDYDLGPNNRSYHKKGRVYKKIKIDNANKISPFPENTDSYTESLICYANVLVVVSDRGWREYGAQVVLDSDDQKDWRISVKFSGSTKYVHKAHQSLQPGTTNRYTHAMMWKGEKDWTLEFTDRSQWSIFKVMHGECFNRNIRSASVKNIPIPGVRLVNDGDDDIIEVPFNRSASKYYRWVGSEVDRALEPSRVLYDMDSGDEECVSNMKDSANHEDNTTSEITDDLFERVMDTLEKVAYAKKCDSFTSDEIEEFMGDLGVLDITKAIYEHWLQKRKKKGLPLIRQFQPALWEHYKNRLKEWELAMENTHNFSDGCQEKSCLVEKPPMFAFCLRPRGLEVPDKGSKQKYHRKLMYHDAFHAYAGRKLNPLSVGEEKAPFSVSNHEISSYQLQSPSYVSSNGSDRSRWTKLYRNNSKKNGKPFSYRDPQVSPFTSNDRMKRNGVHPWDADLSEFLSRGKHSEPDELKLRDASNAAQHASNMAKLKRERAQWLVRKADLALHKATAALMTAEAIKSSQEDLDYDDQA